MRGNTGKTLQWLALALGLSLAALAPVGNAAAGSSDLRAKAAHGDAEAQFNLAIELLGEGKKDEARIWLDAAAQNGHPKARAFVTAISGEQLEKTRQAVAAVMPDTPERDPSSHPSAVSAPRNAQASAGARVEWTGDLSLAGSFSKNVPLFKSSGKKVKINWSGMGDTSNTQEKRESLRLTLRQNEKGALLLQAGDCTGQLFERSDDTNTPREARGMRAYEVDYAVTRAPARCTQSMDRRGEKTTVYLANSGSGYDVYVRKSWEAEDDTAGRGELGGRGVLRAVELPPEREVAGGTIGQPQHSPQRTLGQRYADDSGIAPAAAPARPGAGSYAPPATTNPLSTPAPKRMATGPGQGSPHLVTRLNLFDEVMSVVSRACQDPAGMERQMVAAVQKQLSGTPMGIDRDTQRMFDLLSYAQIGNHCVVKQALAQCDPLPMDDPRKRCDCAAGFVGRTRFGPGLPSTFARANNYIGWAACEEAREIETDPAEHARYELQMARGANQLQIGFRLTVGKKAATYLPVNAAANEGWAAMDDLFSDMSTVFPPLTRDKFYAHINKLFSISKGLQGKDLAEALLLQAQTEIMMRKGEQTAAMTRAGMKILFPPPRQYSGRDIAGMRDEVMYRNVVRYQSDPGPAPAPVAPINDFYGDKHW